jgi:pseudaminic acid cytidylyltransferase
MQQYADTELATRRNSMQHESLAIIPARGGSKRIHRKNLKQFCGQPIIKYSIDAAIRYGSFDELMVSTEDSEIANLAQSAGASVPFLRSAVMSDDNATVLEVIREVLVEYEKRDKSFSYICCIYATAPFIKSEDIGKAFQLLKHSGADSIMPVTRFSYPIQRALRIEQDGKLKMCNPQYYSTRSQDLEPMYHDAAQFFWMKVTSLLSQMRAYAEYTIPFILPETEVQDIDSEDDWRIAECKYQLLKASR